MHGPLGKMKWKRENKGGRRCGYVFGHGLENLEVDAYRCFVCVDKVFEFFDFFEDEENDGEMFAEQTRR